MQVARTGGDAFDLPPGPRRLALLAVLALGLLPRVYRLDWGLPEYVFPDSVAHFIGPATLLAANGELVPPLFVHPPMLFYLLGLLYWLWSALTGEPIAVVSPQDHGSQIVELTMLARGFSVAIALTSIGLLYLVARRLIGTRAALIASALFALAPVPVLESHRINSDGLSLLLGLVAAHQAVVARDSGRQRRLLLAFAIAGLAGAAKYTGLAAVTVPGWIALAWRPARGGETLRRFVGGGFVALAVFALAMLPAAFNWDSFLTCMELLFRVGMFYGQQGQNLAGDGWVYLRYVYGLVVAIPYVVGWPVYLAGLLGFFVLWQTNRAAFGVTMAAVVPFLLVQGAAETTVPRYYQPLVPFLAIAAAAALDRLRLARRHLGTLALALVLGYTALLSASQCRRIGVAQETLGAALAREAGKVPGRDLIVGYPAGLIFGYDPVRPELQKEGLRVLHYPRFQFRKTVLSDQDSLARDRRWALGRKLDAIVTSSWSESAVRRGGAPRNERMFYDHLADGALGFRLAEDFRTHFFTESLYLWADPTLATHWTAGISGYKLYLRAAGNEKRISDGPRKEPRR